jgi:hypothetical protein
VTTLLENLQERTRKAREAMAAELFNWDDLMRLVGERASSGASAVTIAPKSPVDLSQTAAAEATKAKLAEYGFSVGWVRIRLQPDTPEIPALEIRW